jgi:3-dehydroquinate dehydratase/shikimate dehydrogenase
VTLTCATARELLETHRQLVDRVDLVEWRLDALSDPREALELLPDRPGPVIVTARLPGDGGSWCLPESERVACMTAAIGLGVEFVDLEESLAAQIPPTGPTRRIVSIHDFSGTPDDLEEIVARLANLGADVVKLATKAGSLEDSLRVLELPSPSGVPLVKLAMGEFGLPTRVLAPKFGSTWSYCCLPGKTPPAPGQIDLDTMLDGYRYRSITPETKVFAVIGDPIGHSKSPLIHNAGLAAAGRSDCVYLPLRVTAAELPWFLENAPRFGIEGLSVTIPHKEAILAAADSVSELAQAAGAANTLVFRDGQVAASNTDIPAAISSLLGHLGPHGLLGRRVLLLGAGGVCRGIATGLLQAGAQVTVSSRTLARSEQLALDLGCSAVAWDARTDVPFDCLVNGTPVGMSPKIEDTPFPAESLRAGQVVFDTIYVPEHTRLLQEAAKAGCETITGVDMFLHQAAIQFELFTGEAAPLEAMTAALRGPKKEAALG